MSDKRRIVTLTPSDYTALQSLVLKYGSGTGEGISLSVSARIAIADAEYEGSDVIYDERF